MNRTQQSHTPRTLTRLVAALAILGMSASVSFAESVRGYDEYTGAYGQFGISIGQTNGDDTDDTEAQGGFNLNGGYRLNSWLAGEVAFIFMQGEADSDNSDDASYFSFTFGPKIYPLGLLDDHILPEEIQPYTTIAIGGGEYEIENSDFDESSFIARFMFGFDYWVTDHIGAYMEGGYHVASEDDTEGTGVFTFGGQYRF